MGPVSHLNPRNSDQFVHCGMEIPLSMEHCTILSTFEAVINKTRSYL